jgi:hypothetical protein
MEVISGVLQGAIAEGISAVDSQLARVLSRNQHLSPVTLVTLRALELLELWASQFIHT